MNKQCLTLPMSTTYIEAGYKNKNYLNYWKYEHLGADFTGLKRNYNDIVLSSGIGEVLVSGKDSRVGYVLAIRYNNVYNHYTKTTHDVIARYMHLDSLSVKKGDKVVSGTKIGIMGGYGVNKNSYDIHLHLEFDYDVNYPQYSGQVVGGSIFKGGTSKTMFSPFEVLVVGNNQKINKYSNSWCTSDELNIPHINEMKNYIGGDTNMQKLILPINKIVLSASYKNKKYESLVVNGVRMGTHYGVDFYGELTMYGSGNGKVIKTGTDTCFGKFVIVKYENVYNHTTKKVINCIFRYFHMNSINVKDNQNITKDTILGVMGNTGSYSAGVHCHLEADTDLVNWQYTPSISFATTYFKVGTRGSGDTTFNPLEVLHIKTSSPDNQRLSYTTSGYVNTIDQALPTII